MLLAGVIAVGTSLLCWPPLMDVCVEGLVRYRTDGEYLSARQRALGLGLAFAVVGIGCWVHLLCCGGEASLRHQGYAGNALRYGTFGKERTLKEPCCDLPLRVMHAPCQQARVQMSWMRLQSYARYNTTTSWCACKVVTGCWILLEA